MSPEGAGLDVAAFSRQLDRGFAGLRFEPALETAFRAYFRDLNLRRTRVALVLGVALVVSFGMLQYPVMPTAGRGWLMALDFGVILPLLILTFGLSFTVWGQRVLQTLVFLSAVLIGLGRTAVYAYAFIHGALLPYEGLLLVIMIVFLLVGLTFYRALVCVGLIWLAYVGSLWLLGVPERDATLRSFFVTAFMAVGAVAAYVIEHSLRYSYLYNRLAMHHADYDPLTGIANRRKFMTDFARLWRLAERERRTLAVCLVDVDSFKAYNDCYGHIEGDRVLTRVAAALREACQRPLDICARYGGEEFIIVWYDVGPAEAERMASLAIGAVRALCIAHRAAANGERITISAGVALATPTPGSDSERLLQNADVALYHAKREGRDRLAVAG